MSPIISIVQNQYSLAIPAHRFRQGERDVYYFSLTLEILDGLLPQRVEDDVVREANRRLTPSHAKNIQLYLDEKDDWLLGAMMLGIAKDAVEFEPYPNEKGETATPNFGEMRILTNRINTMRIFDGQHRRRAIQDVLSALAYNEHRADKLEALRKSSMTIILYAEDNIKTLRQMFVDASKTKRIESSTVTRFNRRDPFNLTALRLADNSRVLKGRVEMERSSVSSSSQCLLAINQLASILKGLEVGNNRRISRQRNDFYMMNLDDLYDRCLIWIDKFIPAARNEYSGLLNGEVDNSDIPQLRAQTFAYNVTFIRVLTGCYRKWILEDKSWEPLADYICKASLNRGSSHGLVVDSGLIKPDGTTLFSRRQEVDAVIDYIVRKAKETVGN